MDATNRIFPFLGQLTAQPHKGRVPGNRSRRRAPSAPPPPASKDRFLPLVPKDQLYVVLPNNTPASIGATFQRSFQKVWACLPQRDRALIMNYWQTDRPPRMYSDSAAPPRYTPLIQIVDDTSAPDYICTRFGHVLIFPVSSVEDQPDRLPFVIAETLACVHRFASRVHWKTNLELIDYPLEEWEKKQGSRATDAARDKLLDELEATHQRAVEAQMAELLSRGGFAKS